MEWWVCRVDGGGFLKQLGGRGLRINRHRRKVVFAVHNLDASDIDKVSNRKILTRPEYLWSREN